MTPEFVQQLLARAVVRDFLRFTAVGAVATGVHYAVLIGLAELAGVHPVIGTACGALTGGVVSYTLNRIYTFAVRPAYMRGLVKFIVVISIGAALNAGIVAVFMWLGLWYLFAQFIATGLVLIWNFAVSRVVVFRQ
jgi:putative flippase GtrA